MSTRRPVRFDVFEIRVYEEGLMLTVGKMRPPNAPRDRVTMADRERNFRVAEENNRLAEDALQHGAMQTMDEVMAKIKSYGRIE